MMLFGTSHVKLEFLALWCKMGLLYHRFSIQFDDYAFPKYAVINDEGVLFSLAYLEPDF